MNRCKGVLSLALVLSIPFTMVFMTGCDNSTSVNPAPPAEIDLMMIISSPLAPSPGEIDTLTIVVNGSSTPGAFGRYTWQAEAGSLLVATGPVAVWKTPEQTGTYNISVNATVEGASDVIDKLVMVREFERIVTGKRFSVRPKKYFSKLTFIGNAIGQSPTNPAFEGFHVYSYNSPGNVTVISSHGHDEGGLEFCFSTSQSDPVVVGSMYEYYYEYLRQQRMNVWKFPVIFGSTVNISQDNGGPQVYRRNQHRYPTCNEEGTMVAWQARIVGQANDGTEDLFNIKFWTTPNTTTTCTQSHDSTQVQIGPNLVTFHRYYRNMLPLITPNEDCIVYFVGNGEEGDTCDFFEPCLIPIVAGHPDLNQRRALMLTDDIGIFGEAGIAITEESVPQWNYSNSLLAFIDGSKHLCFFDYMAETAEVIGGIYGATEVAWAPDGSECAVVTEDGIFMVSASGVVSSSPIYVRERSTDGIHGLAWSRDLDNPKIGFRMVRKGKGSEDSFSTIVVYNVNEGTWAYATPSIPWSTQREIDVNYTWLRVFFEDDNEGIYAPMPVADPINYPNTEAAIFHSYD